MAFLPLIGHSKQMKRSLLLPILLQLSGCLPGKTPLNFKELDSKTINPQISTDIVTFDQLKTKVLETKCLSCHTNWKDESDFQAKHIKLGNPDHSKMFDAVKAGRMPKGKKLLSTAELELFYNYILNAREVGPRVTFQELKTKVLDPKCFACHKRWVDEPSFQLKYITPGNAERSKMFLAVKNATMPKAPKNPDGTAGTIVPLPEAEQEMIRNYINGIKSLAI